MKRMFVSEVHVSFCDSGRDQTYSSYRYGTGRQLGLAGANEQKVTVSGPFSLSNRNFLRKNPHIKNDGVNVWSWYRRCIPLERI